MGSNQLIQDLFDIAGHRHILAPGHDPENFRGCTHSDCRLARATITEVAELLNALAGAIQDINELLAWLDAEYEYELDERASNKIEDAHTLITHLEERIYK